MTQVVLLNDCFRELCTLSTYLQHRDASLTDSYKKLDITKKVLSSKKSNPGTTLEEFLAADPPTQYSSMNLKSTPNCKEQFTTFRKTFLQALVDNLNSRFPETSLLAASAVLDSENWPESDADKILLETVNFLSKNGESTYIENCQCFQKT